MSHGKQFTLYTHTSGPNGWKVALVLQELGLTYQSIYLEFNKGEQKAPEFVKYNPNGRIPVIIDHQNGDFVLWESDAILQYLVDKYDTSKKLTATTEAGKYEQLQWLFFQASGQGPYFGQLFWFLRSHPERVPSAVERYKNETLRVLGVLENVLSTKEWLVEGKMTIADISFIPWNDGAIKLSVISDDFDCEKQFPNVYVWHNKMTSRPAIKEVLAVKDEVSAKKH